MKSDKTPKPTSAVSKAGKTNTKPKLSLRRKLIWGGAALVALLVVFFAWGLWFSSSQLLSPSFQGLTRDFEECKEEAEEAFGPACGNLRKTGEFAFSEVSVPSVNGYELPGWLVRTAENSRGESKGAIMLVPAGGSDRREMTRHVEFYLDQGLDVLTFDLSCQGEAPCKVKGLSYGERESRDVFSAYSYLTDRYESVYAMGSSVGATSILIALPAMPELKAAVIENPYVSFERLIKEAKEAQSMPEWAVSNMIGLTESRGKFDAQQSPINSLAFAKSTPLFFIHSKADANTPYTQTEELFEAYSGPKSAWYPEEGEHSLIQNADKQTYEAKIADFLGDSMN